MMGPADKPLKQPRAFGDHHQENYWKLKMMYPNFQRTCHLHSRQSKSCSSTNSKSPTVNGTLGGTTPAKNTSRSTLPLNVATRVIPPVNGTSEVARPVTSNSIVAPPVNDSCKATHPSVSSSNVESLAAAAAKSNQRTSSSSKARVVPQTCPAVVTGTPLNSNSMVQGLRDQDPATADDGQKQKRKRRKRKPFSSNVVVEKKKNVEREIKRISRNAPSDMDCSVVQPEVTAAAVSVPVSAESSMSGMSSVPTGNAKKKRGWKKFKDKQKAKRLAVQAANLKLQNAMDNQEICIDATTALKSGKQEQQRLQASEWVAQGPSDGGGWVSPAKAAASLLTKRVTFVDEVKTAPTKTVDTAKKEFGGSRSPCATKYSSGEKFQKCIGASKIKNASILLPGTSSNGTILLDCSDNEPLALSSDHHVTANPNKITLPSPPNPPSSTKQKNALLEHARRSRNYSFALKPLNIVTRSTDRRGLYFGLNVKSKTSVQREKAPHALNASYPSIMECSSDSSTPSCSDQESCGPLATSSQIVRTSPLKRKVHIADFVHCKKTKFTSAQNTFEVNRLNLDSSLTNTWPASGPVNHKKVRFSTEDSSSLVLVASSSENISSSLASSSSGPSVISRTPSPVDTTKKRVQFVPRLDSGVFRPKEFNIRKIDAFAPLRVIKRPANVIPEFTIRTSGVVAAQPCTATSAFNDESVIVLSSENGRVEDQNNETLLEGNHASSEKRTIDDNNNNSSDESYEMAYNKLDTSSDKEASLSSVDLLCSEELGRSMSFLNTPNLDAVPSEEATCQHQSLFKVPHKHRRSNGRKKEREASQEEWLENSIDLAL